MLSSSGSIDLL